MLLSVRQENGPSPQPLNRTLLQHYFRRKTWSNPRGIFSRNTALIQHVKTGVVACGLNCWSKCRRVALTPSWTANPYHSLWHQHMSGVVTKPYPRAVTGLGPVNTSYRESSDWLHAWRTERRPCCRRHFRASCAAIQHATCTDASCLSNSSHSQDKRCSALQPCPFCWCVGYIVQYLPLQLLMSPAVVTDTVLPMPWPLPPCITTRVVHAVHRLPHDSLTSRPLR